MGSRGFIQLFKFIVLEGVMYIRENKLKSIIGVE